MVDRFVNTIMLKPMYTKSEFSVSFLFWIISPDDTQTDSDTMTLWPWTLTICFRMFIADGIPYFYQYSTFLVWSLLYCQSLVTLTTDFWPQNWSARYMVKRYMRKLQVNFELYSNFHPRVSRCIAIRPWVLAHLCLSLVRSSDLGS